MHGIECVCVQSVTQPDHKRIARVCVCVLMAAVKLQLAV